MTDEGEWRKRREGEREKEMRMRIFSYGEICGVNEKEGSVEQRVPGQREDSLPRAEGNSPERQVQHKTLIRIFTVCSEKHLLLFSLDLIYLLLYSVVLKEQDTTCNGYEG